MGSIVVWLHNLFAARISLSTRHSFPACSLARAPSRISQWHADPIHTGQCSLLIGVCIRPCSSSANPSTKSVLSWHIFRRWRAHKVNTRCAGQLLSARSVRLFFAIIEESTELDFGAPSYCFYIEYACATLRFIDTYVYPFRFLPRNKMSQEFCTKTNGEKEHEMCSFSFTFIFSAN